MVAKINKPTLSATSFEGKNLLIITAYIGMSLGGWLSGEIYDFTKSYKLAFINGIFWNIINLCIKTIDC